MTAAALLRQKADEVIAYIRTLHAPVTVAFSGGRDSMVLAHIAAQAGVPVHLLHIHHHLRASAHSDTALAMEAAESFGLPIRVLHISLRGTKGNTQELASKAREEAMSAAAIELGASAILVAHHGQDRVETFIFQLSRGAGLTAALNPRPTRPYGAIQLHRPLLSWSRADIDLWAELHGLRWAEDPSNLSDSGQRNRIRREVVSPWLRMTPSARVLSSLDDIADAEAALNALLEPVLSAASYKITPAGALLGRSQLAAQPAVVRRAMLSLALDKMQLRRSRDWLLRVTQAIGDPGVREVAGAGICAAVGRRLVMIGPGDRARRNAKIQDSAPLELPAGGGPLPAWRGLLGALTPTTAPEPGSWFMPAPHSDGATVRISAQASSKHPLAADRLEGWHLPVLQAKDEPMIYLRPASEADSRGWVWSPAF